MTPIEVAGGDPNPATLDIHRITERYDHRIIVRRWLGCLIDYCLLLGVLLAADGGLGNELYRRTLVIWLGVLVLYFPLLEGLLGRTVGKWIARIVVVDRAGRPPGIGRAGVRTLFRLVEVKPLLGGGLIAGLVVLLTRHRQRIGDVVSGTYVVLARDRPWPQPADAGAKA